MKIGILTLSIGGNIGGILQAWALQSVLTGMGHDVKVVDLCHKPHPCMVLKYPIRAIKKYVFGCGKPIRHELIIYKGHLEGYNRHSYFISKYVNTREVRKFNRISRNDFDLIVIGSDQIWRPVYAKGCGFRVADTFGEFAIKSGISVFAYSASFGIDTLREFTYDEIMRIKVLLRDFISISVREESGVALCRELGVEAEHVLDPTLLLNRSDYLNLIKDYPKKQNLGIFEYILDKSEDIEKILSKITEGTELSSYCSSDLGRIGTHIENWLCGFRDASVVITDSFHACVFSIIFDTPFIVLKNHNRGYARIESLLGKLGLEKNIYEEGMSLKDVSKFGIPDEAKHRLQLMIKDSKSFLSESLNVSQDRLTRI